MMTYPRIVLCLTAVFSMSLFAQAEDWTHWRGPSGNGSTSESNPPTEWSETKNVKWKVAIPGKGSGSPIVTSDKVFVVTAVPTGKAGASPQAAPQQGRPGGRGRGRGRSVPVVEMNFNLLCFDRSTGDKLWEQTAITSTPHEGTHSTNGFASASPCTDGEHVYASFGSRGLYCYKMDGTLVWKRDDFGKMKTRATFGEGSSPTLAGDKIIFPWDHEGPSAVFALDKKTGETIWKTERDEPTNWSTPLIVSNGDTKQIVINGQTKVRAYDLESGDELWSCGGQTQRPCASAVATGDGLVIVGSGFRGSYMGAFKLDGEGNIEGTDKVAWSINRDTPDIASPLLSGNRLYFYKGKTGILTCLNVETGKPYFNASRIKNVNSTYASPVAAGGHVYLTDRNGTTVVIKDGEEIEVVSSNSVGEGVDATPAPAGNELFIRGEKHLFCIAE